MRTTNGKTIRFSQKNGATITIKTKKCQSAICWLARQNQKIYKNPKNKKKTKKKQKKTKNGNTNTNYTIINWNKGNSNYFNKKDTIEYILQQQKPDIMTVQEINITKDDDINMIQIPGYKIEIDQLIEEKNR